MGLGGWGWEGQGVECEVVAIEGSAELFTSQSHGNVNVKALNTGSPAAAAAAGVQV
jgi:hypothetical protein